MSARKRQKTNRLYATRKFLYRPGERNPQGESWRRLEDSLEKGLATWNEKEPQSVLGAHRRAPLLLQGGRK